MAVAGKHLGAAQQGRRPLKGVVFPKCDGGGNHVTSTFDDGVTAWTTPRRQSYGPFLFQHTDSGNGQKIKIINLAGDSRSSSRIALAATLTHLWGVNLVSRGSSSFVYMGFSAWSACLPAPPRVSACGQACRLKRLRAFHALRSLSSHAHVGESSPYP